MRFLKRRGMSMTSRNRKTKFEARAGRTINPQKDRDRANTLFWFCFRGISDMEHFSARTKSVAFDPIRTMDAMGLTLQ